jgi:hypothetical protein
MVTWGGGCGGNSFLIVEVVATGYAEPGLHLVLADRPGGDVP